MFRLIVSDASSATRRSVCWASNASAAMSTAISIACQKSISVRSTIRNLAEKR
jgi:hypothetical protein